MSDNEEIGDEQKLQIAQRLIKSSPPGQARLVTADVAKIVPSHILTEDAVKSATAQHNIAHCTPVEAVGGDRSMLVSAANRVDDTHFIDTHSRQVVEVDHMERKCVPGSGRDVVGEMDDGLEEQRKAVLAAVKEYVEEKYGKAATRGCEVVAQAGSLHVVLGAEKLSLRNFWAGGLSAAYTAAVSGSSASLTGRVDVVCHYFEEGNVQMRNHKDAPATSVDASSPDALATGVVQGMRANEDALHEGLNEIFASMQEDIFKDMRRTRPVSRQPMNWNRAAHDMIRTLRK